MGTVVAKVEMSAEGETLTGTFEVNGGSWPMEQGTVKDDLITFVLNHTAASMTYDMMGTSTGDTIAGQAATIGTTVDWSMARAQ